MGLGFGVRVRVRVLVAHPAFEGDGTVEHCLRAAGAGRPVRFGGGAHRQVALLRDVQPAWLGLELGLGLVRVMVRVQVRVRIS